MGEKSSGKSAIKSDGLSSSYYDLELPDWLLAKIDERKAEGKAYVKTEELIEAIFDNDFSFGTLFKSTVRAFQTTKGQGKEGNELEYECNKVRYYSNRIQDSHENKRRQ
jgi:hypothetical protein